MSTKFYIFGGGRWREVCLQTGTVSGWDTSARFVYCSGKRLQVARRRAVLAGLRALAAGTPTSVRNGPRLSQRRHGSHQSIRRETLHSSCKHCGYLKSKTNTKITEIISEAKQTQTDVHIVKPVLRRVEKDDKQIQAESESTSREVTLDKFSKRPVTRNKSFKKSKQSLIKYRHTSESSDNSSESNKSIVVTPTPTKRMLKETVPPHHVINNCISKKLTRNKNLRQNSTSTNESLIIVPKRSNRTQSNVKTAHTDINNSPSLRTNKQPSSAAKDVAKFISKIIEGGSNKSRSRPVTVNKTESKKQVIKEKASTRVSKPTSETESSEWSGALSLEEQASTVDTHRENNICKELMIDESDVIALRAFLEKYSSEDVLLQFDSDDAFKQTIFYSINPLVRLERCPRTTEMLRRVSRGARDARLADFASQLGLRSVSESSSREPRGYRTRRSLAAARNRIRRISNNEDTDKENLVTSRIETRGEQPEHVSYPRTRRSIRVLGENSPETTKVLERALKPMSIDSTTVSSDSDDAFVKKNPAQKSAPQKSLPQKSSAQISSTQKSSPQKSFAQNSNTRNSSPQNSSAQNSSTQKSSPQKSSMQKVSSKNLKLQPTLKVSRRGHRSGVQEYSALEDAAIVSWVSEGARATRVNGNALWRELCEQYHALTGQKRTWQSVRNRYLRYLLPALGKLSLPAGRAQALRAAAATGNFKNKRKPQRRNSIFDRTEVEAASARAPPRPLHHQHSDTDAESSPPSKRLRSSLVAGDRERGREQGRGATRSRKLFNPNTVL